MAFDIVRLCKDIKGDFFIYGIGLYAQEICNRSPHFLDKEVKAFIVTNLTDQENFRGKQVYEIAELKKYYHGETILVAVRDRYNNEIKKELKTFQYHNVLFLTDYECNEWEMYKGKNKLEYKEYIHDWYSNTAENGFRPSYNNFGHKDSELIVFVIGMEMSMPRNVKIIKALNRKGYETILLCYGDVRGETVRKELKQYSISFIQCNCIEELMHQMLSFNPLLYYIEPAWGDCSWADVILQQKEMFGKIVITLYDVFNDGLVFASERQKELEKYALENADGIVWRWYAKQQLKKQGIRFQGRSIQFLDYCNNDYATETKYNSSTQEELKLCFICGHPDILFNEYPDMREKYQINAKIEDILMKLENSNCSFHIFIWHLSDWAMEKCKELEKKYPNFKAFMGYEHQEILEIVKNYDYGCVLSTSGKKVPDEVSVEGRYYGTVFRDSAANKHFDYLDAGLPVIATMPYKMCDYLNKYQVVIKMNVDNLDVEYLIKNKLYYKEKVKRARTELSIDCQISRLIEFFYSVAKCQISQENVDNEKL